MNGNKQSIAGIVQFLNEGGCNPNTGDVQFTMIMFPNRSTRDLDIAVKVIVTWFSCTG